MSDEELHLFIDHRFIVDPNWVETCLGEDSIELFRTTCIGYWARGIAHQMKGKLGPRWLVWEDDEKCRHGEEPQLKEAMKRFEDGNNQLPKNWHVIDLELVKKAWLEGLKFKGEKWFENGDSSSYDVALQQALFGELRYG